MVAENGFEKILSNMLLGEGIHFSKRLGVGGEGILLRGGGLYVSTRKPRQKGRRKEESKEGRGRTAFSNLHRESSSGNLRGVIATTMQGL